MYDPAVGHQMRHCDRAAEWIVQPLAVGYPSNQIVNGTVTYLCVPHFVGLMGATVADWERTVAGYRIFRIEHAALMAETKALRG